MLQQINYNNLWKNRVSDKSDDNKMVTTIDICRKSTYDAKYNIFKNVCDKYHAEKVYPINIITS